MSKSFIQHPITLELVPRDEYVRPKDYGYAIFGDIESFVSPLDGTVITGRKGYAEHCRKHGVVNAAEFDNAHYEKAQKKREDFFQGVHTPQQKRLRKREIYETITRMEREHGNRQQ